jgi:hypothetical protein
MAYASMLRAMPKGFPTCTTYRFLPLGACALQALRIHKQDLVSQKLNSEKYGSQHGRGFGQGFCHELVGVFDSMTHLSRLRGDNTLEHWSTSLST